MDEQIEEKFSEENMTEFVCSGIKEAIAAREIMNASAKNISELAKTATGPTATKEGQFAFRQALAKHQDIQSIVLQGRSVRRA